MFLLSLFWPPPFSISLSLSLSCSCPFSFLLVFLFDFFWFLVFVSFFPLLSSLLLFHERNNIKIFNCNIFVHQYFLFFCFLSCFLFQIPFSYLCYFLILSYVFVQHQCFWFQKTKLKNNNFWWKGGLQQKFVFLSTYVLLNMKSYRFFCPIFGQFWWMFKKHDKIGISAHFKKAKNWKKIHFEVLLSGPSGCYYLGQVDCNLKMANLAQIITPQICARNFFFTKSVDTPIVIVFFDEQCFVKKQTWPR